MGDLLNEDADIHPTVRRRRTLRSLARTVVLESPAPHPSTTGFRALRDFRRPPTAVGHGPVRSGVSDFDGRSLPVDRPWREDERSTVRGHRRLEGAGASRIKKDEGPTGFTVRSRTRRGCDGYRWIGR